mgnify:CR=1 FL=1
MNAPLPAQRQTNSVAEFSRFMDKFKPQMALALPKHLTADRMARLALTAFSTNPNLQACSPNSIAASIMTASILGLEPGVNGQGFLIPYGQNCQFVPGWKGLVDIANRSGRATVWTGAVFDGDDFDYALGDNPFVRHRPGDEDDPTKMTHVYAIGRVNGSNWPVIEVWTMRKIWKHRDQYNKVGKRHYSFRDQEMYARKVPLLQVLKYMPSSIELSNALAASNAAEEGHNVVIDGNVVMVDSGPIPDDQMTDSTTDTRVPTCSDESFSRQKTEWRGIVESGKKSVNSLISTIETREQLSDEQRMEIASWATTQGA